MFNYLLTTLNTLFRPKWQSKCWGKVEHRFNDQLINESILEVDQGWQCSIHLHQHRYNLFIATTATIAIEIWESKHNIDLISISNQETKGIADIIPPDHVHYVRPGQFFIVAPNIFHRFVVVSSGRLIEIYWTGTIQKCAIDDIFRIEEGGMR